MKAIDTLDRLARGRANLVTHVEQVPARKGVPHTWPEWIPEELRAQLSEQGIKAPWRHQAEAATAAWQHEHIIVATGTASGKSLAYQLPVLTALSTTNSTALYLSPTKALATDQMQALSVLTDAASTYDGDTPSVERDWLRRHGRLILTNPDMLHYGILPQHARWAGFLRRLRYVVIDECHTYRGVFGSHVAHVLRRLRRICAHYKAEPTFILASATVSDPSYSASRLIGLPVKAVTHDSSPRAGMRFALWEPPLLPVTVDGSPVSGSSVDGSPVSGSGSVGDGPASGSDPTDEQSTVGEHGAPVRKTALRETAGLLADLVAGGVRTLAFVRSRRGAELVANMAKRGLDEAGLGFLSEQVAAYRGGYLREERRALENAFRSGELIGLAATSALELGIDISGLDAVLLSGYPGTLASLWQQAGRAGRSGREALCVMIARDDPLDTYLVHNPDALFRRPIEATVLDPANPYVLAPHLCSAASELPLTRQDLPLFGVTEEFCDSLLRRRPTGWYWTGRYRPKVDMRGSGGDAVTVVEIDTGRLLGTVDSPSAHTQVHEGAVYLHQGASYVVNGLDLAEGTALVHAAEPDWTTHARDVTELRIVGIQREVEVAGVRLALGEVDVTNQVVGYQRRRITTGEVIDERPLDLPERQLRTVAVWYSLSEEVVADIDPAQLPGALHAAEHAAIGLLPLVATCDRWDIGGLSTARHPDTGLPTVFVYDGYPGGAGFAERAHSVAVEWLTATREAISACECPAGCPSCVQSPKCGNGNDPLSKAGALQVLDIVLSSLG